MITSIFYFIISAERCQSPLILPPAFMRGVAEGRGESEYLRSQYAKMPTFLCKVGTPSEPVAPGFARIHRPTSPIYGGGRNFFDKLEKTAA